ncbi:MAG TPA: aldo/keto reductase [Caulobacterales bacterium]|nr:aldo/keto reductase [Caulobacterales bacterium]
MQLGLGGAAVGNLYRAVTEPDAEAAILGALEGGFELIDTAPYYGHGLSELRIGAALRKWQGPAPLISSKVGRVLDPVAPGEEGDFGFVSPAPFRPRFDYSRSGVRRSLEESLERLGVAKLAVALVHDVGQLTHGQAHAQVLRQVLDEALPELWRAQGEGLVGAIGIGVNECDVCHEILARAPLDCILLAGRYTLLEQPALTSGLLDVCAGRGVSVMAAGVFNSGLLATAPTSASTYNYARVPQPMLDRARAIWSLCQEHGVAPQGAALRFAAAHPAVSHTIVGARSRAEVDELIAWRAAEIPGALWTALKARGFLSAEAPTP